MVESIPACIGRESNRTLKTRERVRFHRDLNSDRWIQSANHYTMEPWAEREWGQASSTRPLYMPVLVLGFLQSFLNWATKLTTACIGKRRQGETHSSSLIYWRGSPPVTRETGVRIPDGEAVPNLFYCFGPGLSRRKLSALAGNRTAHWRQESV